MENVMWTVGKPWHIYVILKKRSHELNRLETVWIHNLLQLKLFC